MESQLTLIDTEPVDWRLDEQTREVGFEGIAQARAALRAAREAGLAPSTGPRRQAA
jgi:hypothetical protein